MLPAGDLWVEMECILFLPLSTVTKINIIIQPIASLLPLKEKASLYCHLPKPIAKVNARTAAVVAIHTTPGVEVVGMLLQEGLVVMSSKAHLVVQPLLLITGE